MHRQILQGLPGVQRRGLQESDPRPRRKGVGDTAIRNYNKWADIRVNMDTLCENGTPDTHVELFGRSFKYPFFAGPVAR